MSNSDSRIINMFFDRCNEIIEHRKKWTLNTVEKNEIDYLISRIFEKRSNYEWIHFVKKNEKYTKIFEDWDINKKILQQVKEKFEEMWIDCIDQKKKRKDEIKNWKDKFIMNMFNQIQMSLNLTKTDFYTFDYEKTSKEEYFNFLKKLQKEVNVFIYNLSFKEWEMYLRSKFKDEIKYIHENVNTIIEWLKKEWLFDWNKFKKKTLFYKYEKDTNTLYLCTPFWVKNNMWSFFECFWTKVITEYLKYNYYRINWFKFLLMKTWKDVEYYFTPENIEEFFKNENEYLKTFYIKIKE